MPEIVRSTTNNAWEIKALRIENKVRSGRNLREADRPLRERAGKIGVAMTALNLSFSINIYNIIVFSCFDNICEMGNSLLR
jgi:hypothetical protein